MTKDSPLSVGMCVCAAKNDLCVAFLHTSRLLDSIQSRQRIENFKSKNIFYASLRVAISFRWKIESDMCRPVTLANDYSVCDHLFMRKKKDRVYRTVLGASTATHTQHIIHLDVCTSFSVGASREEVRAERREVQARRNEIFL